jgi:hypothetical protein
MCEAVPVRIIKENGTLIIMSSITKRLAVWALCVGLLLLIPLIGMQVSDEVAWSPFDFIFMGTLLFGAALLYEVVAKRMNNRAYRAAAGLAALTSVLLVWINGAVGIIGDGPANALYLGVLAVGFLGALSVRFRPKGMSHVLFVTALFQLFVPVVALIVWGSDISWSPGVFRVLGLNAFFAIMFTGSGLLFRQANEEGQFGAKAANSR